MGEVIGPFDIEDWYTMLALKQSIRKLTEKVKDNPKTKFSLRHERRLYHDYITKGAA